MLDIGLDQPSAGDGAVAFDPRADQQHRVLHVGRADDLSRVLRKLKSWDSMGFVVAVRALKRMEAFHEPRNYRRPPSCKPALLP